MMDPETLAREAAVYIELPDRLGISFTTRELFHGRVSDCLRMIGGYPLARRSVAYIETVDGAIRLDPADIEALLTPPADRAA